MVVMQVPTKKSECVDWGMVSLCNEGGEGELTMYSNPLIVP